jgi:uncharacterized protein YjiS (DUF1127 family)
MSCASTTCSQSQIQALAVPAFPLARPWFLDIPWNDRLRAVWMSLLRLEGRRRQRLALAELDDRLLADIGVSRVAAHDEVNKPFWR